MRTRWFRIGAAPMTLVAALVATTSGSSAPAAGITITAQKVQATILQIDRASGIATVRVVAAATWSPDAPASEGRIVIKNLTDGAVQGISFGDSAEPRSFDKFEGFTGLHVGSRYLITARWRVYQIAAFGGPDGTATSPPKVLEFPKPEPAPRIEPDEKRDMLEEIPREYAACAALIAVGIAAGATGVGIPITVAAFGLGGTLCLYASYKDEIANDPVDPGFRSIAKPATPTPLTVAAGDGLSAVAARAVNEFLTMQARQIGLSRALLTSLNRSQGAHVKKDKAWERRQLLAASRYARQLAGVISSDVKLRPHLAGVLADALDQLSLTDEQVRAVEESLVRNGLPAQVRSTLAKLGASPAQRGQIYAQVVGVDTFEYPRDVGAALADPKLLAGLRDDAARFTKLARRWAR